MVPGGLEPQADSNFMLLWVEIVALLRIRAINPDDINAGFVNTDRVQTVLVHPSTFELQRDFPPDGNPVLHLNPDELRAVVGDQIKWCVFGLR